MNQFSWIFLLVVCLVSCQKYQYHLVKRLPFSLSDEYKLDKKMSNDTSGTLYCGQMILVYKIGSMASFGPLTREEKFALAFRGKYNTVFFEKLHIEEKLYKKFIDSVEILQVLPKDQSAYKPFFPCSSCNYVAELKLNARIFAYPFYETYLQDEENYLHTVNANRLQRKTFLTKNGIGSGVYFTYDDKKLTNQNLSIEVQNMADTASIRKVLDGIKFPVTK
jgi:hypothetical protein